MRDYDLVQTLLEQDLSPYAKSLRPGLHPRDAAACMLRTSAFKKLAPSGQSPDAVSATLKKFSELNRTVSFEPPNSADSLVMWELLMLFKSNVESLLDWEIEGVNFDLEYIRANFNVGPGASRGADSRHFYSKMFDSDHTATDPYLLALFRAAVTASDTWSDALVHWNRQFRGVIVEGNTLFTVPKNMEISRTCCTEPLVNMCLQKALGAFMEERLARIGIKLDRQPDLNRALTRLGSIDESFGTIDLSSASDSISMSLVEWALPRSILTWVKLFRSPRVRYPDGHHEDLKMVSTMGNGFTFPLETIIFASAVRAVYQCKGVKPHAGKLESQNMAVFGDDIVVREDCYDATIALLERLGFVVNDGKSFNNGEFRESCGYDYWGGVNVRPVFITSLETPQDVYSSFNRLARWSAENRVPLVRTLRLLLSWARFTPVPFSWADDSGFKVPAVLAPRKANAEGWIRFRYLTPASTAMPLPEDKPQAHKMGYRDFNPHGWELCFLGGYARTPDRVFKPQLTELTSGQWKPAVINRRPFQGEILPRMTRTACIPYWDWFGSEDEGRFRRSSFQRWEALVESIITW